MKKIFTFGVFLFLLLGIGNNVSASIIKSAGTGLAGSDWSNTATWVGGVVPTSTNTDSVQIVAGDSIIINTAIQSSPTLVVSGVLNTTGFALYITGNAIVKSGGVLSLNKQVYCKNIYNYGKTWAPAKTNSSSTTTVALYVGYTCSATTATASTDSCTILNDGIIGWYRAPSIAATPAKGCGMFVYYANTVKALNITHSPGVTSGYAFTVVQLAPISTASSLQTQDFNLYINESLAFVPTSSGLPFGLVSADVFTNKRTCTIAAGDTVFVAGYFHKNSAPSSVGPMVYNIYGCLDMASYRQSKNEFDIYTSATQTVPVTMNIGDGTLANAGSLIFGGIINIVQGGANQIIFNPTKYSTIKFNYKAVPAILLTNFSLSAYNLYVNSFGVPAAVGALNVAGDLTLAGALPNTVTLNGIASQTITGGSQTIAGLTINNPLGATLASPLNISGALTLTAGKINLGTSNLTIGAAGSIAGVTSSNYVVTNSTGALTETATTSGTLFPIGTTTGYAPVTITAASTDTISAGVSATPTGTFTGYAVNSNEWTLTPKVATTATLAFTPTTATNVTSPVIFSGVASGIYAATTPATLSGSTYTASGIALAAAATPFATGGTTQATVVESNTTNNLLIYSAKNSLVVKNAKEGDVVTVYGITGLKVVSSVATGDNTTITLMPGAYIVKAGSTTKKVLVQ